MEKVISEKTAGRNETGNLIYKADAEANISDKKKILVVDDNEVNCKILKHILEGDYIVLEAFNGRNALEVLEKNIDISLILLDITMPVMDGHEFLKNMSASPKFIGIPVIVTTASNTVQDEITCLGEGATDFIIKPYNPEIVKHRVKSILRLCETSRLLSILEYDQLTGFFSREAFYQHVSTEIKDNPETKYDVICCDICGFKIINEMYGREQSDLLLQCIANLLKEVFNGEEILCGRLDTDVFAVCRKNSGVLSDSFFDIFFHKLFECSPVKEVMVKFGVYYNIDRNLPVPRICSRALLSIDQIKKDRNNHVSFFMDWEKKQGLLNSFESALEKRQFKLYLQAKWNIIDDCLGGAEALVRWSISKDKTILPNEFIPLFEETGIITQLDFYMWEEVCRLLYRWRATGKKLVPISVNMSRHDINTPDLVERIQQMVESYDLPPEMIHFEILERAYAETPETLIEVCTKLRQLGFKIEMDDFGSGYSSLNMLSILPIDYLKLDMNFLRSDDLSSKKSIIASIISLANWLDLEAVAEGVENKNQLDRLRNMGCRYIQGFYFSKPLSVSVFEEYVQTSSSIKRRTGTVSLTEKEKILYRNFFAQKRCTVLVVEDLEITRLAVNKILCPYMNVIEAADGKEAMQKLEEYGSKIDLVLLDLIIPVMDGFQVLKKMKKIEELKNIPVIITSENSKNTEIRAIKSGAESFLPKPHNECVLLHYVRSALIVNGIMHS
ncbi:MAG: EAL domain-containing protein [Treponema sp.]|nr:EAL domain-containing protein [Treponema sp.]